MVGELVPLLKSGAVLGVAAGAVGGLALLARRRARPWALCGSLLLGCEDPDAADEPDLRFWVFLGAVLTLLSGALAFPEPVRDLAPLRLALGALLGIPLAAGVLAFLGDLLGGRVHEDEADEELEAEVLEAVVLGMEPQDEAPAGDPARAARALLGVRPDASPAEARAVHQALRRIYVGPAALPGADPERLGELDAAYARLAPASHDATHETSGGDDGSARTMDALGRTAA